MLYKLTRGIVYLIYHFLIFLKYLNLRFPQILQRLRLSLKLCLPVGVGCQGLSFTRVIILEVPKKGILGHTWIHKGVSKNNGTPKWMVKIMEHPIERDDLGVPLFLETSIIFRIINHVSDIYHLIGSIYHLILHGKDFVWYNINAFIQLFEALVVPREGCDIPGQSNFERKHLMRWDETKQYTLTIHHNIYIYMYTYIHIYIYVIIQSWNLKTSDEIVIYLKISPHNDRSTSCSKIPTATVSLGQLDHLHGLQFL